MTDDLDRQAQRIYTTLELMSDIGAASLGQHVAAGKPGDKILTFTAEPAHMLFRRRYDGCHTDSSRKTVIDDGHVMVRELRFSRRPTIDCQTLEGRLIVGRDQRPAKTVAYVYGYSLSHVYRLRDEARKYDLRHRKCAA